MSDFSESETDLQLLQRLAAGDQAAIRELWSSHGASVRRMVELRLDRRIRSRVGVSDVMQETQVEISRRLEDFLERKPMPVSLWLRKTAYQCLLKLRRHHVEAERRSVDHEVRLPDRSSLILAGQLMQWATPSQVVMKAELADRIQAAIAELPELDRELVLMRNYEELSNIEAAAIIDLSPDAASKRYTRALLKLRQLLKE